MIDGGVAVCQEIFSERGTANREREALLRQDRLSLEKERKRVARPKNFQNRAQRRERVWRRRSFS